MKKNANLGAQLAKSLTFDVEATPQNNVLEIKNTENMTPLNVKVRVRKKIDGTAFVKKGIIAVPRMDLPDTPVERLRLASSDQTIMSFNMLMEADFEKKEAKKAKRSFFGICLGVQGDDDNNDQYLPTTSSNEKDCRSDSGVTRFKNKKPIDETSVAETSSNKSRKKDKFFGKCKPGGCLDPPFGEDKYAYQPQQTHNKKDKKIIDDTKEVVLEKPAGKIFLKQKPIDKDEPNQKVNTSILSLYQGKATTADDENYPEDIITYPPELSSSGQLKADEKYKKNEAKRTSGARQSRNSFNEFSAEYFSPPRTPKESIDSEKNQQKHIQTKELFSPSQAIAKSMSPAKLLLSNEMKGSKDYSPAKTRDWDYTTSSGLAGVELTNTGLVGLRTPLGTNNETGKSTDISSNGISSDFAVAAGLTGGGIATTGLVGLGKVSRAKEDKLTDDKEMALQMSKELPSRDPKHQYPNLGAFHSEYSGTDTTQDLHSHLSPERKANVTEQDDTTKDTETNTPPEERVTTNASLNRNSSPVAHMTQDVNERDLVFHGVDMVNGSEKRISQVGNTMLNRPIHDDTYKDLVPSGIPTNGGSERAFLHGRLNEREGVAENFPSIRMEVTGESDQGFHPMDRSINDHFDRRNLPQERTCSSEGSLCRTERAINETNDQNLGPKQRTITKISDNRPQLEEKVIDDNYTDVLTRGSETGDPPVGSALNQFNEDYNAKRLTNGDTEQGLTSRVNNVFKDSERDSLSLPFTAENTTALSKESGIAYSIRNKGIESENIFDKSFLPLELRPADRHDNRITNSNDKKNQPAQAITPSRTNIQDFQTDSKVSDPNHTRSDKTTTQIKTFNGKRTSSPISKSESGNQRSISFEEASNIEGHSIGRPVKHGTSVSSDKNSLQYHEIAFEESKGGLQKGYWENNDERTAMPTEIESHDSRSSSQRRYAENKHERTTTPVGLESHDSRNSSHKGYAGNKDGRSTTPVGIASLDSRGSSQREYWEKIDGRTATPIGLESHKSRGSLQEAYAENKYGRTAAPLGLESLDSRGSSQKGYWENKDGRAVSPLGLESHDSRGSSQRGYGENSDGRTATSIGIELHGSRSSSQRGYADYKDGRTATPIGLESHDSRGSSQKGYAENKEERIATPTGMASLDSRESSQRRHCESKDGRTTTPIEIEPRGSRSSLQKGYAEYNDGRTATPIGLESHGSRGRSQKGYAENKEGRIATPTGMASLDSRESSQRGHWENKDGRTASPTEIETHDYRGSPQRHYAQNTGGLTATPIQIESHDSRGSSQNGYAEEKDRRTATPIGIESHDSRVSSQKVGHRTSRESIFLNLAFQTYQDDNQMALKSLDSAKKYDQSNAVIVKSLVRSHDKTGVTVPIDSKHVMNIAITSMPVQERKSRIPKPISRFDSGRSDYSGSTISIKDLGNDPHAVLSMVFHQELVPLESIIRSLKEDIDALAAQQMMLTDRLSDRLESQRIRPVYSKNCGCLKRISSLLLD